MNHVTPNVVLNSFAGRHEAYYKSKGLQTVRTSSGEEFTFVPNELVRIEVSYKVLGIIDVDLCHSSIMYQYSETDMHCLFSEANLRPIQRWLDSAAQYSLWLLERPPFIFPLLSSPSSIHGQTVSAFGVPTLADWETLWTTWDFVSLRMIPPSMLYEKPIDLRHICLFYLGHIPTFLDIQLSRLLGEPHTEPEYFKVCCFISV